MKKVFTQILLLFVFLCGTFAQYVSNVSFYQEGKNVVVTYSLDKAADVSLQVSTDGGKTFSADLQKVSGNVGKNTKAGNNRVVWDVLSERECLIGNDIVFQVVVTSFSANITMSEIHISGVVVDTSGEPLIGASIMVEGTTCGTITDFDGIFELTVPSSAKFIIVESYRMKKQKIPVQSKLRVVLSKR